MASKTLASVSLLLFLTLLICFSFVSCNELSSSALDDDTTRNAWDTKAWDSGLIIDELKSIKDSLISFLENLNPGLKEPAESLISSLSSLILGLTNGDSIGSLVDLLKSVIASLSRLIKQLITTFDLSAISKFIHVIKPLMNLLVFLIKLLAPQDYALFRLLKFLFYLLSFLIKKLAVVAPHLAAELLPLHASLSLLIKAFAG